MTSVYWEDVGARHASPMYSLFSSTLMSTSGCCRVSPLKLKPVVRIASVGVQDFGAKNSGFDNYLCRAVSLNFVLNYDFILLLFIQCVLG